MATPSTTNNFLMAFTFRMLWSLLFGSSEFLVGLLGFCPLVAESIITAILAFSGGFCFWRGGKCSGLREGVVHLNYRESVLLPIVSHPIPLLGFSRIIGRRSALFQGGGKPDSLVEMVDLVSTLLAAKWSAVILMVHPIAVIGGTNENA